MINLPVPFLLEIYLDRTYTIECAKEPEGQESLYEIKWKSISTIPLQTPSSTEFTIGHNVNSKKEVDAVMKQAKEAGAKIVKSAGDTFWGGYSGYFQDPDGHLWEVVWNPQMKIED